MAVAISISHTQSSFDLGFLLLLISIRCSDQLVWFMPFSWVHYLAILIHKWFEELTENCYLINCDLVNKNKKSFTRFLGIYIYNFQHLAPEHHSPQITTAVQAV